MGSTLSSETWPPTDCPPPTAAQEDLKCEILSLQSDVLKAEQDLGALRIEEAKYAKFVAIMENKGRSADDGVQTAEDTEPPSEGGEEQQQQEQVQDEVEGSSVADDQEAGSAKGTEPVEEDEETQTEEEEEDLSSWLQDQINSQLVVAMTKSMCPFCAEVRKILQSSQIEWLDINVDTLADEKADALQAIVESTTKRYGVPVVWVSGDVADIADLKEMQVSGELNKLYNLHVLRNTSQPYHDEEEVKPPTESTVPTSESSEEEAVEERIEVPEELLSLDPRHPFCLTLYGDTSSLAVDRTNVFSVLGAETVLKLCMKFVSLLVKKDVFRLYEARGISHRDLVTKLSGFLCERLGGPQGVTPYAPFRSSPSILCCPYMLHMTHCNIGLTPEHANEWLVTMRQAISSTDLPPVIRPLLDEYFAATVADLVKNVDMRRAQMAKGARVGDCSALGPAFLIACLVLLQQCGKALWEEKLREPAEIEDVTVAVVVGKEDVKNLTRLLRSMEQSAVKPAAVQVYYEGDVNMSEWKQVQTVAIGEVSEPNPNRNWRAIVNHALKHATTNTVLYVSPRYVFRSDNLRRLPTLLKEPGYLCFTFGNVCTSRAQAFLKGHEQTARMLSYANKVSDLSSVFSERGYRIGLYPGVQEDVRPILNVTKVLARLNRAPSAKEKPSSTARIVIVTVLPHSMSHQPELCKYWAKQGVKRVCLSRDILGAFAKSMNGAGLPYQPLLMVGIYTDNQAERAGWQVICDDIGVQPVFLHTYFDNKPSSWAINTIANSASQFLGHDPDGVCYLPPSAVLPTSSIDAWSALPLSLMTYPIIAPTDPLVSSICVSNRQLKTTKWLLPLGLNHTAGIAVIKNTIKGSQAKHTPSVEHVTGTTAAKILSESINHNKSIIVSRVYLAHVFAEYLRG